MHPRTNLVYATRTRVLRLDRLKHSTIKASNGNLKGSYLLAIQQSLLDKVATMFYPPRLSITGRLLATNAEHLQHQKGGTFHSSTNRFPAKRVNLPSWDFNSKKDTPCMNRRKDIHRGIVHSWIRPSLHSTNSNGHQVAMMIPRLMIHFAHSLLKTSRINGAQR